MKELVPEFEEVRIREIPKEFQGIRRKTRKKIQKVLYLNIFKEEYKKKQAIKEVGISSSTFYKDEYEPFVEFISEEFEKKKKEIKEEGKKEKGLQSLLRETLQRIKSAKVRKSLGEMLEKALEKFGAEGFLLLLSLGEIAWEERGKLTKGAKDLEKMSIEERREELGKSMVKAIQLYHEGYPDEQIQKLESKVRRKNARIESLKAEIREKDKKIKNLRKEKEKVRKSKDLKEKRLKEEISRLKRDRNLLTTQLSEAERELDRQLNWTQNMGELAHKKMEARLMKDLGLPDVALWRYLDVPEEVIKCVLKPMQTLRWAVKKMKVDSPKQLKWILRKYKNLIERLLRDTEEPKLQDLIDKIT